MWIISPAGVLPYDWNSQGRGSGVSQSDGGKPHLKRKREPRRTKSLRLGLPCAGCRRRKKAWLSTAHFHMCLQVRAFSSRNTKVCSCSRPWHRGRQRSDTGVGVIRGPSEPYKVPLGPSVLGIAVVMSRLDGSIKMNENT